VVQGSYLILCWRTIKSHPLIVYKVIRPDNSLPDSYLTLNLVPTKRNSICEEMSDQHNTSSQPPPGAWTDIRPASLPGSAYELGTRIMVLHGASKDSKPVTEYNKDTAPFFAMATFDPRCDDQFVQDEASVCCKDGQYVLPYVRPNPALFGRDLSRLTYISG